MDVAQLMIDCPHNSDTTDRFNTLLELCYHMDKRGLSLDEFVDRCLNSYGGTVAGALVDYLYNKLA